MAQKAFRDTYIEEKEGETGEGLPLQTQAFPPLRWYHQVILKTRSAYLGRDADAVRVTQRTYFQASPLSPSFQPLPSDQNQNNNKTHTKPKSRFFCFVLKLNFPEGRHPHRPLPVAEPSSLSGEQPAAPSHGGDGEWKAASSGPGLEVLSEALAEAGSGRL